MPDTEMREIEIVFETNEVRRITIPASWKITFGAIAPGAERSSLSGWGLRIYEAQDKQRAVFTHVQSFRDRSLPVKIKAIRKFGTQEWYRDDGTWSTGEKADLVQHDWIEQDGVNFGVPPFDPDVPNYVTKEDDDTSAWATYATRALKPSRKTHSGGRA